MRLTIGVSGLEIVGRKAVSPYDQFRHGLNQFISPALNWVVS
jgi:hypothetical protein